MTEKPSSKSKLDLAGLFKGLFQRKKSAPAPVPDSAEPQPEVEENQETQEPGSAPRPRPATTATITVSAEERVFQSIAIIGPASGALHNMEQILLRRGYDVDYINLITRKRGAFEKYSLDHPIPEGCECIVLFEPLTAGQAKSVLGDIRKQGDTPVVLISRQLSNPAWAPDLLKQFNLSDRFLVRFSFRGLLTVFRRIASQPPAGVAPASESSPSVRPPAPAAQPPGEESPLVELPLVEETLESSPEPVLVEAQMKSPAMDIEEKVEVLCVETQRPMAELAPLANEPQVHYRVEGKESEGIDPGRILTRREFERLFHSGFQERWRITRIQDPKAMPPILVEVKRLIGEEQEEPPSATAPSQTPAPSQAKPEKKPLDLKSKIKEVRKRWQEGRLAKLCNDLEQVRKSFPDLRDMDGEAFVSAFVPLVEGTILFAKSRLDRTVETTLEEFLKEDFSRHGIQAPLRVMALLVAGRDDTYKETFDQAEQTLSIILSSLLPKPAALEEFHEAARQAQDYLSELDELVEETLRQEDITPGLIYGYFDKLQKITTHLHKTLGEIDQDFLIFGRLDQVILRSQTRSDWAFDHAESPEQWQDRLHKFLRYLAEIRIETLHVRHDLQLLIDMADQGIAETVTKVASEPAAAETLAAETLERIDQDHLQEPRNKTIWHIHRHRANYLIDLIHEDDPNTRAFATFDEEEITYSWLGVYQATEAQVKESLETESTPELAAEESESEEEQASPDSPEEPEKPDAS